MSEFEAITIDTLKNLESRIEKLETENRELRHALTALAGGIEQLTADTGADRVEPIIADLHAEFPWLQQLPDSSPA